MSRRVFALASGWLSLWAAGLEAKEGAPVAQPPQSGGKVVAKLEGLAPVWTVKGTYSGVASSVISSSLYALNRDGRCDVLDPDGKTTRTFPIENKPGSGRVARCSGATENLLGFSLWAGPVASFKTDGTKVWEQPAGDGIDDVWAADLDGDGIDEVIVGHNGSTGLRVFSSDGKPLWARTKIGNVWHVAAGDVDGDGKREVVTTSAQGKVHLFASGDGSPIRVLDPGLYANMVRVAPPKSVPGSKGDVILVAGGHISDGLMMVAMGGNGQIHWKAKLPSDIQSCREMIVSPDGKHAAVATMGWVCVVDLANGRILAQASGQGQNPSVAWLKSDDAKPARLVVANGNEVAAYRVEPAEVRSP